MLMRVTFWISPSQDLYHTARWLSGLHALHRSGKIALRIKVPGTSDPVRADDPLAVPFQVNLGDSRWIMIVDLHDRSDSFSEDLLKKCDIYFKRSYREADLFSLGADASKVRPLGLNYACRTPGLVTAVLAALVPGMAVSPASGLRWLERQARRLAAIPPARLFERSPSDPVDPAIIFQTRVWEEGDTGDEPADAVNEPRVALIRALREAFGPQFRGGLVPTPLARRRYPDALADSNWRKSQYLAMSGRQAVGIYTRGLHDSTAWKLPEYLAASQCIVAEPPRNSLPRPLIDGTHYLGFGTADECVAACRALLDDPALRRAMREANYRYYRDEVAPASWVANRLAEATAGHLDGVVSDDASA